MRGCRPKKGKGQLGRLSVGFAGFGLDRVGSLDCGFGLNRIRVWVGLGSGLVRFGSGLG